MSEHKGRLLLRVDVVEEPDGTSVHLITGSHHVEHCTNCLSLFALRISHSIATHVMHLQDTEADDGEETTSEHNSLH